LTSRQKKKPEQNIKQCITNGGVTAILRQKWVNKPQKPKTANENPSDMPVNKMQRAKLRMAIMAIR